MYRWIAKHVPRDPTLIRGTTHVDMRGYDNVSGVASRLSTRYIRISDGLRRPQRQCLVLMHTVSPSKLCRRHRPTEQMRTSCALRRMLSNTSQRRLNLKTFDQHTRLLHPRLPHNNGLQSPHSSRHQRASQARAFTREGIGEEGCQKSRLPPPSSAVAS